MYVCDPDVLVPQPEADPVMVPTEDSTEGPGRRPNPKMSHLAFEALPSWFLLRSPRNSVSSPTLNDLKVLALTNTPSLARAQLTWCCLVASSSPCSQGSLDALQLGLMGSPRRCSEILSLVLLYSHTDWESDEILECPPKLLWLWKTYAQMTHRIE